ncbi:MAG: hypothetical protein ACLSEX_03885 [Blautia sp.]
MKSARNFREIFENVWEYLPDCRREKGETKKGRGRGDGRQHIDKNAKRAERSFFCVSKLIL